MLCQICKREVEYYEKHHLYPIKTRRKSEETIIVCNSCGDNIHLLFTNNELQKEYNTLEKLLNSERLQKYIQWISNKPESYSVCCKKKKRRR